MPLEPVEPLGTLWNPTLGTLGTPWNLWNPVYGADGSPGPAPKDPFRRQITAAGEAVLADRFLTIMAAGGSEAALHAEFRVNG